MKVPSKISVDTIADANNDRIIQSQKNLKAIFEEITLISGERESLSQPIRSMYGAKVMIAALRAKVDQIDRLMIEQGRLDLLEEMAFSDLGVDITGGPDDQYLGPL